MKLNIKKSEIINSNYPVIKIDNFINNEIAKKITLELDHFSNYDDSVMSGRQRINKGSSNFDNFINSSPYSSNLYNKLNNFKFYKEMSHFLDNLIVNQSWQFLNNINFFCKKSYGKQKSNILDSIYEKLKLYKFKKNILNLDIDFSKSKAGYNRGPHRDRDTRVLNFLIYLNSCSYKDGGNFNIYNTKKKNTSNPRFPKRKNIKLIKSIKPKVGSIVIFKSTPDSYHEASLFRAKKKFRYFIYGSFSLNKPVNWSLK